MAVVLVGPVSAGQQHHPACKPMVLISEKALATGGLKAVFQNQNKYPISATWKVWFDYTKISKGGVAERKTGTNTQSFTVPAKSKQTVFFVGEFGSPVFDRWRLEAVRYGYGNGCPA